MDTGSSKPIAPQEVLRVVENFHAKCVAGKKINPEEIKEFYHTIIQGTTTSSKEDSTLVASMTTDSKINAKIMAALQKLKTTLGQNKAVIEASAGAVPYPQIEKALNSLERYLKHQEEEERKVSRKEKATGG